MTLFLLLIWCVDSEFTDAVNSIRQVSLSIHWRFQGLRWPYFHWRFMDQPSNNVFDNSMHHMSLFLLSIWFVGHEFIDDVDYKRRSLSIHWWFQGLQRLCFCWWFMVQHRHRVFDNSMRQPWLYFLLSIWCVSREFIDGVDFIHQLSLSIHWWFWLQWLYFHWRLRDKPWHIVFDNSMSQSWLYFFYR